MDWASDDYARGAADSYVRQPDSDVGIYLLDDASRAEDPNTGAPTPGPGPRRDPLRVRAPGACGRYGCPLPRREGFNGSGTPYSERGSGTLARIFAGDWDERPEHYNPAAGADRAHLVPPPCARPYGGGPAPSLAFPVLSQSEGANNPNAYAGAGVPARECFGGAPAAAAGPCPHCGHGATAQQFTRTFLLILALVLAAMAFAAFNRLEKTIKKLYRAAPALAASPT